MKNQIFTLTCTWAASYGAVLQAYALSDKLNRIGWSAQIINYQPNYGRSGLRRVLFKFKERIFDRQYVDFLRDTGNLTSDTYTDMNSLKNANFPAQAYIVGSDQVWNCSKYYNGKDDAMFLDFAKPSQKRIAYAASLAMPRIPSRQVARYVKLLEKFDVISVREETGKSALAKIGVKNIKTVIDPVYLVSQAEWAKLASKSTKKVNDDSYVLVICLEERDELYRYARAKADILGVKLYSLRGGATGWRKYVGVDKNFWNISVYDYLSLIKNTEAVVTDSFHAMSFSLIFNRDVDIIPRSDTGNSRMSDLLTDLGIPERITSVDKILIDTINYPDINQKIEKKVEYASRFLKDALKDEK